MLRITNIKNKFSQLLNYKKNSYTLIWLIYMQTLFQRYTEHVTNDATFYTNQVNSDLGNEHFE